MLIWIVEDTWQSTIDQCSRLVPDGADVTVLHVIDQEAEALVAVGPRRRLGHRRAPAPADVPALARAAADELLRDAGRRLGGTPRLVAREGRAEHEVVAAAAGADLLVLSRDGDRRRLGPKSLGPAARFVVDHAPCPVLLLWPGAAPDAELPPPPPPPPRR